MTKSVNKMTETVAESAVRAPLGNVTAAVASDQLARQIAAAVVAGRRRLGLSQDQLAARSGASKGTIVQIEQGQANPSISSLCRIAVALGVSVEDLVSQPTRAAASVVVSEPRQLWRGPNGGSARLQIGTSGPNMLELWTWELARGECHASAGHTPGTREIISVTKGSLQLELGGEIVVIDAGWSATFEADQPHSYTGKASGMTAFAMVVEEPGSDRTA